MNPIERLSKLANTISNFVGSIESSKAMFVESLNIQLKEIKDMIDEFQAEIARLNNELEKPDKEPDQITEA